MKRQSEEGSRPYQPCPFTMYSESRSGKGERARRAAKPNTRHQNWSSFSLTLERLAKLLASAQEKMHSLLLTHETMLGSLSKEEGRTLQESAAAVSDLLSSAVRKTVKLQESLEELAAHPDSHGGSLLMKPQREGMKRGAGEETEMEAVSSDGAYFIIETVDRGYAALIQGSVKDGLQLSHEKFTPFLKLQLVELAGVLDELKEKAITLADVEAEIVVDGNQNE